MEYVQRAHVFMILGTARVHGDLPERECSPSGDSSYTQIGLHQRERCLNASQNGRNRMASTSGLRLGKTAEGWLIRLEGKGTLMESTSFHQLVSEQLSEAGTQVCVDLSGCEYLDSTFLGCLVKLHTAAQGTQPPQFTVFAPPDACQRLLCALHLDRLLVVVDALPETVGETAYVPFTAPTREQLADMLAVAHRRLSQLGGPCAEQFARIAESMENPKPKS